MEKNRNNSQWHSLLKRVAVIISMLIILAGGYIRTVSDAAWKLL